MATSDYVFVSFFDTKENLYYDTSGAKTVLGPATAGTVMNFSSPAAVIGQPADNMTRELFYLTEWSNLVLAGREFVTRHPRAINPTHVFVYATEAAAVVNVTSNGAFYTSLAVAAGAVEVITDNLGHVDLEFRSTADVLISTTADGTDYVTVPPAAQTIFGQCSAGCILSVLGGDDNINITRSCTNGTVEQVQPGDFWDVEKWKGDTCSWSAPEGYKISGRTKSDGTGFEGVAFIAAEHFHRITPLAAKCKSVLLISDSPAVCTRSDGGSFSLTGAVGVFHSLLEIVSAGVVLECDRPFTVIADGRAPADFPYDDSSFKEMNLVMRTFYTTTTTTATITSSTSTTTTATTTTASNTTTTGTTATNTTLTGTATTTGTTATSTTSATNTSITATSTSATSTATTVTTTSATLTSATNTTTTVTTTSATGTTVTFTGPTTTSTATTVTSTTATDTSVSTTDTATNVTTTATATSVSTTATNVTTTDTATTVSSTATNVTTTATATSVSTTATNITTTATATTISSTTGTLPTTRTTETTSSLTATTPTATDTTTQTATTPTSTSSSTTATATTATSTTSSVTTSTATTETETTSTETLTTVTSTSSTSSSDTSTTATDTSTTQTMTSFTATDTTTTHSDTSTTTLTALVTATTTTSTVTTLPPATVVVKKVESIEGSMLSAALDSNDTTSETVQMGNFTLVAAVVDAEAVEAAGGSLTVVVEGTNASVTVPASMLDSVVEPDGTILVVTAFDSATSDSLSFTADTAGETSSTEVQPIIEVKAAMNVNLFNLKGARLAVDGLLEPIKVVMPVNYTKGIQCVWWDEAASDWSTDGVQLATSEGGLVVCETFHLTLFAAILEGFTQTFLCSQVTLLNMESIKELRGGGWWLTGGAIVLWSVIVFFMGLLSVAHCLDRRRIRQGLYDAEHLLIPSISLIETRNPIRHRSTKSEVAMVYCGVCATCCCWIVRWARSSAALRDALDDVVSNWVTHFSELRDFVEGLFGGLECCSAAGKGGVGVAVHRLMTKTLTLSARRQAAAELGLSQQVSCAVMEHEDIKQVLLAHHSRGPMITVPREETWGTMHSKIEDQLDNFMETSASWSALPGTVWRLFCWQTPFGACLVHCNFRSSKLRVLLFMVEIIGSLMLGTVFFQASGLPGKRNRSVDCSFDEAYKMIGRILAIGTGSIAISGVPAIILNSLCTKNLKKFDYEGCPEWNKQLRIWRTQTSAIWVLGLLYIGFCIFFMSLFLANARVEDQSSWLLSGFISVLEDTVLIPLSIAVSIPLLSALCLNLVSHWKKVKKGDLVYERRMQMKHEGNMTLALQQI